jgi:phage gpG-like protein
VVRITIDSLGQEVVAREILRPLGRRASDLRPAMDAALDIIRDAEGRQFDTQGADGSGGWAPLADSTVQRKARAGLDPRILHATGDLVASVTTDSGDNIGISRKDGLDFGTTLPYAGFHQTGTGRMPARPVVQLPERDRRQIMKVAQRYLVTGKVG